MVTDKESLPPDYFERMFAGNPDPWDFETSPYEAAKFEASIAALGVKRYERCLEVGCANGALTRRLMPQCDAIVAIDVSATALACAHHRNNNAKHVTFEQMTFPRQTPDGQFDLIVLSEVVYYWNDADVAEAGGWIAAHLALRGDLLLVHWIGDTDYPQTGDDAVTLLSGALPDVEIICSHRTDKYRLDLWRKL